MNFTAKLPSGVTKDVFIAQLPQGSVFCTRRPQICATCGENSLVCSRGDSTCWQPLPPKYKVGCLHCGKIEEAHIPHEGMMVCSGMKGGIYNPKKYAIRGGCSGRGTSAICECGHKEKDHETFNGENKYSRQCYCGCVAYKPLSCELVAIDDDLEWTKQAFKGKSQSERYEIMCAEAAREGFQDWQQWEDWMTAYYGGIPKCWRYQFKR